MTDGRLAKILEAIRKLDESFVHLPIQSSPKSGGASLAEFLTKNNIEATGLIDEDGRLGKQYGARSTPHMFVIGKKGILQYSGAIDSDKLGKKPAEKVENYVVIAVEKVLLGKRPSPRSTAAYGDRIRYPRK